MDTLTLDQFTKEIILYRRYAALAKDDNRRTSFLGHTARLIRKRDSLSKILFGEKYEDAVKSGKYETWITEE